MHTRKIRETFYIEIHNKTAIKLNSYKDSIRIEEYLCWSLIKFKASPSTGPMLLFFCMTNMVWSKSSGAPSTGDTWPIQGVIIRQHKNGKYIWTLILYKSDVKVFHFSRQEKMPEVWEKINRWLVIFGIWNYIQLKHRSGDHHKSASPFQNNYLPVKSNQQKQERKGSVTRDWQNDKTWEQIEHHQISNLTVQITSCCLDIIGCDFTSIIIC